MASEWRRGAYRVSTDLRQIDFDTVHRFLSSSYWSPGIARETVERAARNALVFGLHHDAEGGQGPQQVGYARVLTDYVAIAYVLDVFVLEAHRGGGLARWLMETILAHPELRDVRTWLLKTRDAHRLYETVGFCPVPDPERFMVRTGTQR